MERKGLRKKDILRMDGLLPPTRRVPVCDAVTSAPEKKKDKKWSIGGILRRISSIRDYDSSSNDEEIVYCKRTPRKPIKLNGQPDDVVLHSIENNSEYDKRIRVENNIRHLTDSPHSRGSDGSLDGFGRKTRKNKLKARAEAKRDHLCADSSSDEDCRKSNNSLNKSHGVDGAQNGPKINALACNRKTRAARTERYIKRLSRDESNDSVDTLNELHNKRYPSEYIEDKERNVYADTNGFCRPPIHPRRIGVNSHNRVCPVQKHSTENLRDIDRADLADPEILSDYRRYSIGQYVTDLNQNNTYGKISRNISKDANADNHRTGNFFTYPAKNASHYPESYAYAVDRQLINLDTQPPEPPPRDPRCRMFRYGYGSYPIRRHQNVPNFFKQEDNKTNVANGILKPNRRNFRLYGSNNEIACRDTVNYELKNSMSSLNPELRNSLERIHNNKYNCSRHCVNESVYKETEASRCRRRNIRNDQLNCSDVNYSAYKVKNKSANICESNKHHEMIFPHASAASSDWSPARSCEQRILCSVTPTTYDVDNRTEKNKTDDNKRMTPTEEVLERRRSSKNLEEALSELEAIYNSLRLGDEDLLDRAERRSMEEFSLKQSKNELNAINVVAPDSPDRTKDDMAYRRMHPKERPTSLSDIAGQSTLSNISYLIASPVLTRRDAADDFARASSTYPSRRDEPDVTRDDVVFRSINHANNTLRVIDPQPPFGIPLGPVTAATESDYLHTTPTKPEQPRSSYIPQCEPDVVTDDLAYRSLRKDAVAARNVADNKIDFSKEQPVDDTCGMKKKRAVRSLSANLYGLINHDRIHLRRESNLDNIKDEIYNQERVTRNSIATSERPGYLRRVVSDGELSENDTRKRKELVVKGDIDINGNHPMVGAYRKKLCVYVSPEATMTRGNSKKEKESSNAELSDAMLSSKTVLDDKFWHEYLRSDSNVSAANSGCSTGTDFTAYSRLCQDLVNLIKDDDAASSIEPPNTDDPVVVNVTQPDKSDDFDIEFGVDELPTGIHSLDRHYSGSRCAAHANDEENVENENAESPITFSTTNSADPSSESTSASNLDFYLRVADENVKIIAEAFGNVADRLRDSHLLVPKNSSSHSSEIETQSGSTRSSTLYSQDEEEKNVDRLVSSKFVGVIRGSSKRNSWTSNEGDQYGASHFENVPTADAELDLSRAVHDLQLAAASLCEHGREIEDLGIGRGKVDEHIHNVTPTTAAFNTDEEEDKSICKINLIAAALRQEQQRDQNVALSSGIKMQNDMRNEGNRESERIAVCEFDCIESCYAKDNAIHNVTLTTAAFSMDEEEDKPICEISLIADALRQEQDCEQEGNVAPPSGIETRSDVRSEGSREGERTVCELDRIESWYAEGDAQSASGMRFPYVTNLITVTVTTYSMLLLACLVALLLAIVAAS